MAWQGLISDLMAYLFLFLSQYYLRENLEVGFSCDKRLGLECLAKVGGSDCYGSDEWCLAQFGLAMSNQLMSQSQSEDPTDSGASTDS